MIENCFGVGEHYHVLFEIDHKMSTFNLRLSTGPALTYHRHGDPVQDVTGRAHEFLNELLDAGEDVTLYDYLALLGISPLLQAVYTRDFAESIFQEVQKGPLEQPAEDPLEYLELYFQWRLDSSTRAYSGLSRMQLHGIGTVLQEDRDGYKSGQRIAWGLTGLPLRELLSIPVRVNHEVSVIESDADAHAEGKEIQKIHLDAVTLGQVLHGLLWELSFHGSPVQAQAFWEEIKNGQENFKADQESAITATSECIFKDLGLPVPAGVALIFETIGGQDPWGLGYWLKKIPDQDLASEAIALAFQGEVVVKPEYRKLTGYAFRRAFRLADADQTLADMPRRTATGRQFPFPAGKSSQ